MSISDPEKLVEEFKKSGEFDRLRRELLQQFRDHEGIGTFMSRVQDIVQQRLAEDERLHYLPPEAIHNELMQDMDRFPLVQRTVADLPALTDPAFNASIRRSLAKLLDPNSGKRSGGKKAANGDAHTDDDDDSHSEGSDRDSDSSSDSSNDADDDINDPESEDEPMPGVEREHEPAEGPTSKGDASGNREKAGMANGVKEATNDRSRSPSPSSSPVNQSRPRLDS